MSQTVENKVVEFQFNNSNFEKNVKTSMGTLDKLKEKLKFDGASKSFSDIEKAAKNFDISNVGKSADAVASNFNALEAIAVGALHKIGAKAVELGEQLVNTLMFEQMSTGFAKYTKNTESVATIMNATGESVEYVDEQLKELLTYTDKTSYSYSALVDNVSTLVAMGIPLADAIATLEGIGNLNAFSGVSAQSEKAANNMYNLANAISMGALTLRQWRSVQKSIGTEEFKNQLIETAKAFGTLDEYSIDAKGNVVDALEGFDATLTDGWATADVLVATLQRYADETTDIGARSAIAASEAKTFADAVGAVKDALSTGWMQTYVTTLGNYTESAQLWTGLQDYFLEVLTPSMNARNELLTEAMRNVSWNEMISQMHDAGVEVDVFKDAIVDAAREHGYAIDDVMADEKDFAEVLRILDMDTGVFADAIDKSGSSMIRYAAAVTAGEEGLSDFERLVRRVMSGELGYGEEAIAAITAEGYNANAVMDEANLRLNNLNYGLSTFSDSELELIGVTREQRETLNDLSVSVRSFKGPWDDLVKGLQKRSGRQLLIESLYNALDAVSKILSTIKDAWDAVFDPITADDVYRIVESINEFTASLIISDETADKLQRTFEGLFAALDIVATIIKTTISVAIDTIRTIFGGAKTDVLGFTGAIGDNIVAFRDWLAANDYIRIALEKVRDVIVFIVDGIKDFIEKIANIPIVKEVFDKIKGAVEGVVEQLGLWLSSTDTLESKWDNFKDKIVGVLTAIKDWADRTAKSLGLDKVFGAISGAISKFWESLKTFFSNDPLGKIGELFRSFKGFNGIDFTNFNTTVKTTFEGFIGFVDLAWGKITGFVESLGISFGKFGTAIGNGLGKFWDFLKGIFSFIGQNPGIIFSALIGGTLAVAIVNVSKAILNFSGVVKGFSNLLNGLGKAAAGYGAFKKMQGLSSVIKAVADLVVAIGTMVGLVEVVTKYTDADIEKTTNCLLKMVGMIGALVVLNGIFTKPAGGNIDNSSTMFSKNNLVNINNNMSNMIGVVGAIVAMTNALDVISKIPAERLKASMWTLTFMVIEIAGITVLLGKLPQNSSFGGALTIASFGLSLSLMAGAIEKIAKIDDAAIRKGLKTLAVLIVEMGVLTASAKSMTLGKGFGLMGMVLSIKMLIGAFDDIAAMDFTTIHKGLDFLQELFADFILLGIAARVAGKDAWALGVFAIGIGAALYLIVEAMQKLNEMSPEQIKQAGVSVGLIMGVMAALLVASSFAGKNSWSAGVMLLGMGASMILIAKAAEKLGALKPDELKRAVIAIDAIILAMSVLVAASRGAGKSVGTIAALAGSLVVLVLAVAALSYVAQSNERGVEVATACISALMVAFGILVASSGLAKKAHGTIILLGIMVAALALVLTYVLSLNDDINTTLSVAAALSLLLIALAGVMFVLGESKDVSWKAIGQLAVLTAVVAGLAALIALISNYVGEIKMGLEAAASISLLLIAMSAALYIMGQTGEVSGTAMAAMLVMGLTVGALMAVLGYINSMNASVELGLETAAALSVLLIGMSGALVILSAIGPNAANAMAGILALDVLIADLLIVLTAIGFAFEELEFFSEERLQKGIDILVMLGEGLGKAFGAFVGGVFEGVASSLPTIGTYLGQFMENAQPFFDGVTGVNQGVAESVGHLAAALLLLTAAELLSGISAFIGMPSMALFGTALSELAPGLKSFAQEMDGVNTAGLKNAAEAAEHLSTFLMNLPREGGLWQKIVGEVDMEGFAEQIGPMGKGLKTFSDNVKGVDSEAVSQGAEAAGYLADLANNMVERGGWLQKIMGEKENLAEFGAKLVPLAIDLKGFSYHAEGVNAEAVKNAADAAGHLADLANNLRAHDGVLQTFIGDASLTSFGVEIERFGNALVYFSNTTHDLSLMAFQKASKAGGYLADLGNNLQTHDGVVQFFTGDNGLDDFGVQIKKFASSLVEFSSIVTGANGGKAIDTKAIETVTTAVRGLVDLSNELGDAPSLFNDVQTLGDLGVQIYTLGEAIQGYSLGVKSITPEEMESMNTAILNMMTAFKSIESVDAKEIKEFSSALKTAGTDGVTKFLSAFTDAGDDIQLTVFTFVGEMAQFFADNQSVVTDTFETIMQNSIDAMNDFTDKFAKLGEGMILDINRGMQDQRDTIPTKFGAILKEAYDKAEEFDFEELGESLVEHLRTGAGDYTPTLATKFIAITNDAVNSVRGKYQAMYDAGMFLAQGLANGVTGGKRTVVDAGTSLANSLVGSEAMALDEKSPSKISYGHGKFWVMGLANAIYDYAYMAEYAAGDLGEDVANSTADTISAIDTIMSEGMDFDPVIVPVLDLSEIQNGTDKINEMLGNESYTLAGSMNLSSSLARSMGQTQAVLNDTEGGINESTTNVNNSFSNTFNIQAVDPYAAANEISEILQSQVERSNAVWA